MNKNIKYTVAALLALSALMLGILVPGGPIETRSFSNFNPIVLGLFNIFLTVLGLTSFVLIYFILKGKRWSLIISAICGISYLAVYLLDLGKIFPVSKDPMPTTLTIIEALGSIISLPLIAMSFRPIGRTRISHGNESVAFSKSLIFLIGVLVIAGIGIVVFATKAALR
jgi:uncharacterized membrane protein (UPF0136 family)